MDEKVTWGQENRPRDSRFHLNPSSLIQAVTLLCMRRLKAALKVL